MSGAALSTDDIVAQGLSSLGPWGVLAALAYRFGAPFVKTLLENSKKTTDPTPAEWDALIAKIEIPGEVLIPKRPDPVP